MQTFLLEEAIFTHDKQDASAFIDESLQCKLTKEMANK